MKWSKTYLNYSKQFIILGGGATYYMSNKSIQIVKKTLLKPQTHVLEDVMISNILAKNGIFAVIPKNVTLNDSVIQYKNKNVIRIDT